MLTIWVLTRRLCSSRSPLRTKKKKKSLQGKESKEFPGSVFWDQRESLEIKALFSFPRSSEVETKQVVCWCLFIYNLIFLHPRCPCFCSLALIACSAVAFPRCGWMVVHFLQSRRAQSGSALCGYGVGCFRYWILRPNFQQLKEADTWSSA